MINATKEKVGSYFLGNCQFIVPFFQRSYVWDEENWNTLWEHTALILERQEKNFPAEHFIGTIITKQRAAEQIGESKYDLIDGQQRLTTIALLLKAISDASNGEMPNLKGTISEHLCFRDAHNNSFPRIVPSGYDKPYYDAILAGQPLENGYKESHKIIRAYRFFLEKLTGFSDDKLDLFRLIILNRIPVISMMLSQDDDEQEIFDTINALGVRLTTGELLKNYIFKEKPLQIQYDSLWKDVYESDEDQVDFWNAEKTAGRIIRTNIEVLLYCYLIIKQGGEIKLEKLFKEYKDWLSNKTTEDKLEFLRELKGYAEIYSAFPSGSDLNQIAFKDSEKRFFHIVENLVVTTIYPLVLYIYKNVTNIQARSDMLSVLESYIVRRNVCRLTAKNYNSLFIQIMTKLEESRRKLGVINSQTLSDFIREFSDPTNLMPSSEAFCVAFRNENLSNQNAREVLFIIALYQVSTGFADMPNLSLGNYSVEHMMPVKWETNWLLKDMTPQEKAERDQKLQTLGNLTLVTHRLNSKMQNSAWADKKLHLKKYSSLRMTVDYLDITNWDEKSIETRAKHLAEAAAAIWKWVNDGSSSANESIADSPAGSKADKNEKQTADETESVELTTNKALNLKFWLAYKEFITLNSSIPSGTPHARHWMTHPLGVRGAHLSSVASMSTSVKNSVLPQIGVDLVLTGKYVTKHLTALSAKKNEIEKSIGQQLIWPIVTGGGKCRISIRRDADFRNPALWQEQHEWLLQRLETFNQVFRPLFEQFNASVADA